MARRFEERPQSLKQVVQAGKRQGKQREKWILQKGFNLSRAAGKKKK